MSAKKTEVAIKEETAVAKSTAPGQGLENIDSSDIIIPRIKVVYSLSQEMKDPELRKTLKPGMLINSVTKEELKSTTFTVLHFFKMWGKFNPMKQTDRGFNVNIAPGATDFITTDKNDARINPKDLEWTDGMPPLVIEMRSFMVLFDGEDMPAILSFFKSSNKSGKELATQIFVPGRPAWDKKFTLYVEEKTDKGVYYVFKTKPAGRTSDDEKAKCKALHEMFAGHAHKAMENQASDLSTEATDTDRPY